MINLGAQGFLERKLATKELRDKLVDEHCMLLWIKYNSERLKMDRKGISIPNSRVGAVSSISLCFSHK
jgi:hypothetical protein